MREPAAVKATILVADDNSANLELLAGILEGAGYGVVCASDGQQALKAVFSGCIDMVLLDVMMPGQSGFAACLEIKSRPETRLLPVVLVTALTGADDRIQGIMCGADDFLNKPVNKHELLARVQSLLRMREYVRELENAETVLFSMALSIEAKDPFTGGHCERLSKYAVALGERLRLPEDLRMALRRAGFVHDVGKIAVPERILTKPGPLTDEEWKIMREHPAIGERICSPLNSFRLALPAIRHHHEKLDGSGYPDGLRGEQIPLVARVLQIVDVYDALTTKRPYRDALPPDKAFATMWDEARRGWIDGSLLNEFEAVILGATSVEPAKSKA